MKGKLKTVFWGFFSLDYRAMEKYLENMAEKGWMLEKAGRITAKFREIEPKNLRFCVDVFKEGEPWAPDNYEEAEEYRRICKEAGWNYVTSHDYLQFFYAAGDKTLTPIQPNEELEQQILKTSLWWGELGRVILLLLLMLGGLYNLSTSGYRSILTFTGVAGTILLPLLGIPLLFMGLYC